MIKTNHLILVVLLVIASMMAFDIFRGDTGVENAYAQGQATDSGNLVAVPVQFRSNEGKLCIVAKSLVKLKSKTLPAEWHLAVYSMDNRFLKVEAIRNIEFDLKLSAYNIEKDKNWNPSTMRKKYEAGQGEED